MWKQSYEFVILLAEANLDLLYVSGRGNLFEKLESYVRLWYTKKVNKLLNPLGFLAS